MSMDPGELARLTGMYESAGGIQLKDIENKYKLGKAQIAGSYKEALLRSGDARAGIEESREYHRGALEQARQEMERIGIPDMEIRRFVAEHNYEIAKGELGVKQQLAQTDAAYKQGTLQQARDEMLQMGIPKVMVDRYVAESQAAYQRGQLALTRDQMEQIGIPAMLTDRYSAESQSAYQQGQLGLTAQQQQQNAIEQQRRYALDVAKYGTELSSQPDRYFQAQQFASQAPRLLGLQAGAGPTGGPTPGINQMGNLLAQATEGLQNQATPYQLPTFPTAPGYNPPRMSRPPAFPTMPGYDPPPLGPMPTFPDFAGMPPATPPVAPPTATQGGVPDMGSGSPDDNYLLHAQGGIPGHAAGGWVGLQGPELGWLGERGPEYVVPNGAIPGGTYTPWTPPGGWQPGDQDMRLMIDDPGWAPPQGDPYQARLRAGRGGGYGITPEPMVYAGGGGAFDESGGAYGGNPAAYKAGGGALAAYDRMMARFNNPGGGMQRGWYNEPGQPEPWRTGGGGMQTGVYHLPGYEQPGAGGQFPAPRLGQAPEPDLSALAPDEQARYRQLVAYRAQRAAAGEGDLSGEDIGELQRYQARVRQPRYPTGTGTYGGPTAGARPTYTGGPQAPPASSYGAGDPREKQLAQIAKASPPSPYDGLNEQDQSTLRLMESIYKRGGQGVAGGELERLGKSQRGFMASAGNLLGYDPSDFERSYQQYRPAQGSAALAG